MINRTKFIAIEGPDRVGKATQTMMLSKYLQKLSRNSLSRFFLGSTVKTIEVPIKTVFYKTIYRMYIL